RRADPSLGAGDPAGPEDRRHGAAGGALSDAGRGRQARRRQLLPAHPVRRGEQAAGSLPPPLRVSPVARSRLAPPAWASGLSARLLGLTFAFVMVSEVLIFAPSAGRFRVAYLEQRLAAAHIAILALQATPDQAVSDSLQMELLDHARAYLIALRRPDGVKMVLGGENTPMADATFDLRDRSLLPLIGEAFMTLLQTRNRILRVIGTSPRRPDQIVEVVIDEAPMRNALIDYSERILLLSVVISLITAGLLFFSLQRLMVRPMRRLTESMIAFREDPENGVARLPATRRRAEIGMAQRELVDMEEKLRAALHQKTR